MENMSDSVIAVHQWLDRHRAGDDQARQPLLEVSMHRLRLLARRILRDIPEVRGLEESDDLLQNSVLRLWRSRETTHPDSPLGYFRLAACLIRRELIDVARHHSGKMRMPRVSRVSPGSDASPIVVHPHRQAWQDVQRDDALNPAALSPWTEFHEYIEKLPEDERALFDRLWYQGLTMADASSLLEIPLRTLGRRWKLVRVRLSRDLLANPDDKVPPA
jgi:RNA polymerase sigma-70 factor (ECF subfamily)